MIKSQTTTQHGRPTPSQVVRAHNTIITRRAAAHYAQEKGVHRGWMANGVRRAKTEALRAMTEYFGVGDGARVGSSLHAELSRDRVPFILKVS